MLPACKPSSISSITTWSPQDGKLEKWVKSEDPPANNNGPVRVLTAKTFEQEVFQSGKDVFIKFYAPWW